jgi:hypothetical protein
MLLRCIKCTPGSGARKQTLFSTFSPSPHLCNTTKKLFWYIKTSFSQQEQEGETVGCIGIFQIASMAPKAPWAPAPKSFVGVLCKWGCLWLWKRISIECGTHWISAAVQDGSLVVVTDGSYIKCLYPHLCLATFVLECAKGRGQIIRSFAEATLVANAYREKLLGIMATNLLLVSVNKVRTTLTDFAEIVSDCLGALKHMVHLPTYQIPF